MSVSLLIVVIVVVVVQAWLNSDYVCGLIGPLFKWFALSLDCSMGQIARSAVDSLQAVLS